MHDAYIIRAGKGEYHSDNNIYLAVYDKALGDFTHTELISKVWGGGNSFGFMRSWIADLDQDGNHRGSTHPHNRRNNQRRQRKH